METIFTDAFDDPDDLKMLTNGIERSHIVEIKKFSTQKL
jgi:hypothetical protein